MRLLLEIVFAGLLVVIAWEKPFKQRFGATPPAPQIVYVTPAPTIAPLTIAPTSEPPSGSWMWDPNRRTPLDRATYNQTYDVSGPTRYYDYTPGHSYNAPIYTDRFGKYWVDKNGNKHYLP